VNRYVLLHATTDLTVSRFDHPPHEAHHDPEEEIAGRWALAFVVFGTFDIAVDRDACRLRRGSVLLTRPGLSFRCRHAEACPTDVCLSIGFDPQVVPDVESAWMDAGWVARRSASPRLAYVARRLEDATLVDDHFQMERWALASLSALESDVEGRGRRGQYGARGTDVEAVVATCQAIEADPALRSSVAERARGVGLSGAQLTRAFRRYVGTSPHEYVMRWRLATAADLLDAGHSVSECCYRSGFENLSHFCRTFRQTFGTRASSWHRLALRERRTRLRELLRRPRQGVAASGA
jgi:AraC family transcriptional regulator